MAKDPAFLFFPNDFLSDVVLMSDEQIGKYIKLKCFQHKKGRLSEEDVLKICKTYDEDIMEYFEKDKKGLYYHKEQEEETNRRKEYSESRRKNRLKSKEKKKDSKHMSSDYDGHMVTVTDTVTETEYETINKKVEEFKKNEVWLEPFQMKHREVKNWNKFFEVLTAKIILDDINPINKNIQARAISLANNWRKEKLTATQQAEYEFNQIVK